VSVGWVAGSTRARLLLENRVGRETTHRMARATGLGAAAEMLAGGRLAGAATERTLEAAQRAVADQLVLELRLLAGWLPAGAGGLIRTLAGWFEIVNIEDRLAYLLGADLRTPLHLGALASAWPGAEASETPGDLRAALRSSAWGDPGEDTPEAIHLGMRVAWARRVIRAAPEARAWAGAALALLLARERFLANTRWDALRLGTLPELGGGWVQAATLADFTSALPARVAFPLAGIDQPEDLWRGELRWWRWVEADAEALVRRSREGRAVVVGAVALLAADAVRAAAALASATTANAAAVGAFDDMA
jgi:hypothetical protein